jgi:imidazolonepropionase-like amidohydrolase
MSLSHRLKTLPCWMLLLIILILRNQESIAQPGEDSTEREDTTLVAFVNVAVVSMQYGTVLQNQTVVIQRDRILSINPADAYRVLPGTKVINGSGRYLMPGLADMHVHISVPFENGPLFLNAGITTVLSMGTRSTDHEAIFQERERSRRPDFIGPEFYTVGPLIYGGSPDEVERMVRENVEHGYDLVKIYRDVSPEAFARLNETADRLGTKVTGHAQRSRGMQPVYEYKQDLAHVEEYLYAAFNPTTPGYTMAVNGSLLVLIVSLLTNLGPGLGAIWRRARKHQSLRTSEWFIPIRKWMRVFTAVAWLFFIGLNLSVTPPFSGVFAGSTLAIAIVGILLLLVVTVSAALTLRARNVWHTSADTISRRVSIFLIVGFAWSFVICASCLTPRSWRTTDGQLERIARETAESGIWVTPNLVVLDYRTRQTADEFYALNQRPEMRYLKSSTRNAWINNNPFRVPDVISPLIFAARRNYQELLSRLVEQLHDANVPLLAGSDVGTPGVLPGSSLHEDLHLLVQAGLTPYEALQTATVNAASYLGIEQEVGQISVGHRADLVLLRDNPLDDIDHIQTRVGVMKRGRWFSAEELETALSQLAEARK